MSRILALDTSTEACSVALWDSGEVREIFEIMPRRHADNILPMVRDVLQMAGLSLGQLDAIAFGRGPGSFTGLRIATGVAQGLAFGSGVPVLPVSTLAALAWQAHEDTGEHFIISCLDARIGEIYWGCFQVEGGQIDALLEEQLCAPEAITLSTEQSARQWFGAGNGWALHESMPALLLDTVAAFDPQRLPRAGAMAHLAAADFKQGRAIPAEAASPVYLRDKVTHHRG